jgi:hypothetical protein
VNSGYVRLASCAAQTRPTVSGRRRIPTFPEQRVAGRQAAAEQGVGLGRVAAVAGRVNMVVEPPGGVGMESIAGVLERREGVGMLWMSRSTSADAVYSTVAHP